MVSIEENGRVIYLKTGVRNDREQIEIHKVVGKQINSILILTHDLSQQIQKLERQ